MIYPKQSPSNYRNCIATQDKLLDNCENMFSSDLQTLDKFLKQWKLTPNPNKTEVTVFHLNNKMTNYNLEIIYRGFKLKHVPKSKYLGVTLDRFLSFKTHLTNVASMTGSRINIIQKLTGSDWDADFLTLENFHYCFGLLCR